VLFLYFITVLLGIIAFAFTVQLSEYAAVIIVVMGLLGGLMAKELNLFGTTATQTERQYMHADRQKSLFQEDPPRSGDQLKGKREHASILVTKN